MFFNFLQIIGTFLLLLAVCAIGDPRNAKVPSYLGPLYAGLAVLNIGICFGYNCGYAINPARDFSPRLFTLIAGWGSETFTFGEDTYQAGWAFVPVLGPFIGAILGAIFYSVMVSIILTNSAYKTCFKIALFQIENHWPEKPSDDSVLVKRDDESQ